MRAQALLDRTPSPTEAEVRAHMEPNLCPLRHAHAHNCGDPFGHPVRRPSGKARMTPERNPPRRRFLTAGSVMVGFTLLPGAAMRAAAQTSTTEVGTFASAAPDLPGSLKTSPMLDAWIRIDEKARHGIHWKS